MTVIQQQPSEVARLIRERRTVRSFSDRPLERELVLELLRAAADAQALTDARPGCRFLLIVSPEGRMKAATLIMDAYAEQKLYRWMPDRINRIMTDRLARIPAYLIAIAKQEPDAEARERSFAAICALLHRFSLLAWERKIGLVWNTDWFLHRPSFAAAMGLRPGERIAGMLCMGHFDKMPKGRPRTPAEKKWTELTP